MTSKSKQMKFLDYFYMNYHFISKAITHLHISQNLNGLNGTEGSPHTEVSRMKYLNIVEGKKKIPYYKTKTTPENRFHTLSAVICCKTPPNM